MTDSRVLIIGHGVVGTNLEAELAALNPDVCDKYKGIEKHHDHHEFGFVCVDTPLIANKLDVTEVFNAIEENDCDVYVIKSTVPVGITDKLAQSGKRVVFSPEYYGGTQHCNNFAFDFTVLGGDSETCHMVQQLLQDVYDARHVFHKCTAKEAEMTKFMENAWLATKVSFCQEFWRMCNSAGIDYDAVRENFNLDPRVNPAHTFVYDDHPWYQSHCLDKDVPAIAHQFDSDFLKAVIKSNDIRKSTYEKAD